MPSYGSLVINPSAPTFSNGGVFTISSKNFGDAPFTPAYPTSNSLGAFTYTSSATSVATVNATTGVVTIVAAGTATIRATQAAAGVYKSGYVEASLVVTINLIAPTFGSFTLPTDIQVYQNQTITRQLTPPTSTSTGTFSYTSSNTAVATITNNAGVYSINIIAGGYTVITATQAASGIYTALSTSVTINTLPNGFSEITNSDFTGLDFNTGMTTLFTNVDDGLYSFAMPNSNFSFNSAVYNTLYVSSNGWLSFNTAQVDYNAGASAQLPINTFRFFGDDHVSSGSYKFDSNNTRLLVMLTGYKWGQSTKTFTIKLIIDQFGLIQMNYTLASTYTSDPIIIGRVGSNSAVTTDDTFLTLNGVTFNGSGSLNLYSLLNGKTIIYV